MKKEFIRTNMKDICVATLYLMSGSGMGNEHSEISHVYIGADRDEVNRLIASDYDIKDKNIEAYLNRNWGSISYYDEEARREAAIPDDQPTKIRVLRAMKLVDAHLSTKSVSTTFLDGTAVHYICQPEIFGVTYVDVLTKDVLFEAGHEFTVGYETAKWFCDHPELFEMVK